MSELPLTLSRQRQALTETFERERDRWLLWGPVGMGIGIAAYFALDREPGPAGGLAAIAAAILLGLAGRWRERRGRAGGTLVLAGLVLGTTAFGFTVAKMHSDLAAAPVLERRIGPVAVSGRLVDIEPGIGRARITLEQPAIGWLEAARTPYRVRIGLRHREGGLARLPEIGTRVRLRAVLMPPPEPAAPGAFDFARAAWFERLGAVGYAVSRMVPADPGHGADARDDGGWAGRAAAALGEVRRALFVAITRALPGESGAIAAALMTGERGRIPPDTMEAMRAAGLAHLLAISGLHIGLVAGCLFFAVRAGLALWPRAALGHPIKKYAAGAAFAGGLAYMLLTGATVPTQRAFLMTALVLLAVAVDRTALSMRLVAWAGVVVLLIAPQSLTGPSFQMSFAAVIALIAGFETLRGPLARMRADAGPGRRALAYVAGVLVTTLIAGLATAPFALYHFNRVAVLGVLANLGAVPLTALWIMPFATLAYGLAPLGLEGLALSPMGWGIDAVTWIARAVAGTGAATVSLPAMPAWGVGLCALGGLWLALWRTRWRLWGVAAIALGLMTVAWQPPPDILVAADGRLFAVRGAGGLSFGGDGRDQFARHTWLRRAGLAVPDGGDGRGRETLACDAVACVAHIGGRLVSILKHPAAAAEDCRRAQVVVALVPLHRVRCRGPELFIGRYDLAREGAHALWLPSDGPVRVRTVSAVRGARPWNGRAGRHRLRQ